MNRYFLLCILLCVSLVAQSQTDPFGAVNSPYDEQLPVLSPDQTTLYFTRAYHPGNVGGQRDPGDIWSSFLYDDGTWSEPQNEKSLNTTGYNGVVGFTVDARGMFLLNQYNDGKRNAPTQGISLVTRKGKGWSKPQDINIPYYRNRSNHHSGFISADGQFMLLALESYQTVGGEDIYVCFNEGNGKWSEPKNLGRTVNTSAQEFTPFLSPDGTTLYFSSNGHRGSGSSDVFSSTRLDNTWKSWSEPVQVPGINSQGRELGYRAYNGFAIYVSTQNSDGFSDIKYFAINPDAQIEPVVSAEPEPEPEPEADIPSDIIYGTVKDASTRQPVTDLQLKVVADGVESEVTNNASSGYYEVQISTQGEYRFEIDAPGYLSLSEVLDLTGTASGEAIEQNFLLSPIAVGTTIQLPNVLFQRSSPNILPESYPELNRVVAFMNANPKVEIRLEGHTDNTGVQKANLKLSKARVESVKAYLVDKGISGKRISGKGYGGTKPIADNTNEETRRLNRRVEFTITKD